MPTLFADPVVAPWLVAKQIVDEIVSMRLHDDDSPLRGFDRHNPGDFVSCVNRRTMAALALFVWPSLTSDQIDRLVGHIRVRWDEHINGDLFATRSYRHVRDGHRPGNIVRATSPEDNPSPIAFEFLGVIAFSLSTDPDNVSYQGGRPWTWAVPLPGYNGPAQTMDELRLDDPMEVEPLIAGVWPHLNNVDRAILAGYVTLHWMLWRAYEARGPEADVEDQEPAPIVDGGTAEAGDDNVDPPAASTALPSSTSASSLPTSSLPTSSLPAPSPIDVLEAYIDRLTAKGVSPDVAAQVAAGIIRDHTPSKAVAAPNGPTVSQYVRGFPGAQPLLTSCPVPRMINQYPGATTVVAPPDFAALSRVTSPGYPGLSTIADRFGAVVCSDDVASQLEVLQKVFGIVTFESEEP